MLMGVQVPGKSVHAIYVTTAEVIHWSADRIKVQSYLAFLKEVGATEVQVIKRPADADSSERIVSSARSFVASSCDADMPCTFRDSKSFASHCFADGEDWQQYVKAAGTMGACVLVAAHVDEAAAAVALPVLGAGPAVAIGVIGAVVVSPLL